MEAKSFLKTISSIVSSMYAIKFPPQTYSEMGTERFIVMKKITLLSKFYSQAFPQDMIEGLFKYWKKSEFNNDYESAVGSCIYFVGNSHYSIRVDKNNPKTGISLPLPKTLDDFICDIERADVMLLWKEEISEKYFNQ